MIPARSLLGGALLLLLAACTRIPTPEATTASRAEAPSAVPAGLAPQFRDDFESPAQSAHWRAWSNLQPVQMELAAPGYESATCLRLAVPAADWCTPIVEFPTPIRVSERTVLRFRIRCAPGMIEGINVRNATDGAEYLLTFPLPGSGWTVVQRYLRNSLYKRFGKPDAPKDGVVGDEVSSLQIAYMGTELSLDNVEIFEATSTLPELPSEHLLPQGSYTPRRYPCLERIAPFGVISTVAAGDAANAALFGQTADERFEDDLLDLKRHGMNAISNFCDDGRVAWRLALMERYRLYLVETALANTDLRGLPPDAPSLQLIAANRNHPRLLAWYGRDEPQDCLAYLDNKRAINRADPNHPLASAFNQMQVAKLLGPYMELLMLDPYSVFKPERSVEALAFHADLIRNAKQYCQDRKVWLIPQTFSWRNGTTTTMRMPDPAEARFDVFNALGAGANGFLFFIYNDTCTYLDNSRRGEEFDDTLVDPWGNAHPTYAALSDLGRALVPALPALLDAVAPGTPQATVEYAADKLTLGRLRNAHGDYLVLTNKNLLGPYQGTASVPLATGQALYDLLALREIPVRGGGAFDLDLPAGGGALLMVASARHWRSVERGIRARRFEQEHELLSVECDVLKAQRLDVRPIAAALKRARAGDRSAATLRASRELLAQAQRANPAGCAMTTHLEDAQRTFGEIHALIRPRVAQVDGTQDPAWLESLAQLKALSNRYFSLRRRAKSGDFSGDGEVTRLLAEQQVLKGRIAALPALGL
jgi:hypothetical protein